MHIYRIISLGLLLGASRVGLGQTTPSPDDSTKGRLWTATAQRIWVDTKPKQPQPKAWPTVQAFEQWLAATPADKSELGLLHAEVVRSFGAGTKASPTQVAQAIIGQVTQRQQGGQGRLARVKVPLLGAELAPLTQARATAEAPSPEAGSRPAPTGGTTTVTALPGAGGVTALPANPDSIINGVRPAPPVFTTTPVEPRYFGLPPNLAGLVLLLAGGLLGLGLAKALGPDTRRRRHRRPEPDASAELDSTAIMSSQEYRKLQKQNQTLNTQLHRLRQELAELKQQLTGAPASAPDKAPRATPAAAPAPASVPAPAPVPALPSIEEQVGALAEVPTAAPAATRYGPVQETPFLEERKIVDNPLPQLALMLTVNPRDPNQATFTLNPQVDQARLIGDGLTRLQKFFDYDPPLGGRISAVAAVRPGRLQRHDSGWQVVERARLAIS